MKTIIRSAQVRIAHLQQNPLKIAVRHRHNASQAPDDLPESDTDFILSILQASPSVRDSRSYIHSFAPPTPPKQSLPISPLTLPSTLPVQPIPTTPTTPPPQNTLVTSLLNPTPLRPALVKIQGPFTDPQLHSIAQGLAHLQKLGLVSVILLDRDDLPSEEPSDAVTAQRQRTLVLRDVERMVAALGRCRAAARPVLATVARIGKEGETEENEEVWVEEEGLDHIRRAVGEGDIPVLLPLALDEGCRSRRVSSDRILLALAKAMSTKFKPTTISSSTKNSTPPSTSTTPQRDLTPLRLLIINREGGIPSYARSGLPHLSINLTSEYTYIQNTFLPHWTHSHPAALQNLSLSNRVLTHLPRDASALIVSHRSPASLIANLITNKPAHSVSLPHALLSQVSRDTPTLIRRGLPVRVLRSMAEVDRGKLKGLLEASFGRRLDEKGFYERLERDLDFVIVIGDYAGAAVCTLEGKGRDTTTNQLREPICYLDKFAVLPSHQGDGTVDFLWVALRDETYGLGLLDASNPSPGSLSGVGEGRDLVWRSRSDNPVNKWYYERSSGFVTLGGEGGRWKMFWCDAEERVRRKGKERDWGAGREVRVVEDEERGRLDEWGPIVNGIQSAWL